MHRAANHVLLSVALSIAAFTCLTTASAQDPVAWSTLGEAQERAQLEGKTLFVFVEAPWCGICKRMKKEVFSREGVMRRLDDQFIPVSIDLESKEEVIFNGDRYTERSFAKAMNVRATPTMLFVAPTGTIQGSYTGYASPERFLALLGYVVSDVFGDVTFGAYVKDSRLP